MRPRKVILICKGRGGMEDWVLYRGRRKSLSRGAPPSQFEALAWMRGLISQKVL